MRVVHVRDSFIRVRYHPFALVIMRLEETAEASFNRHGNHLTQFQFILRVYAALKTGRNWGCCMEALFRGVEEFYLGMNLLLTTLNPGTGSVSNYHFLPLLRTLLF